MEYNMSSYPLKIQEMYKPTLGFLHDKTHSSSN